MRGKKTTLFHDTLHFTPLSLLPIIRCCLVPPQSSSYQVLIPHLVFLDDFEQVKSIGRYLDRDWKELLADCFPKIMVSILPYFALSGQDAQVAQQQEKAHKVYDLLKDDDCLGKQVRLHLVC